MNKSVIFLKPTNICIKIINVETIEFRLVLLFIYFEDTKPKRKRSFLGLFIWTAIGRAKPGWENFRRANQKSQRRLMRNQAANGTVFPAPILHAHYGLNFFPISLSLKDSPSPLLPRCQVRSSNPSRGKVDFRHQNWQKKNNRKVLRHLLSVTKGKKWHSKRFELFVFIRPTNYRSEKMEM